MKAAHSTKWNSSTQPRKQRKYAHNAPDHLLGERLNVHLSKELHTKHKMRSLRARSGDKVRIVRGTHKGKEGAIEQVDLQNSRLYITKVEHAKREGGSSPYPIRPSNCILIELTSDKRRMKV